MGLNYRIQGHLFHKKKAAIVICLVLQSLSNLHLLALNSVVAPKTKQKKKVDDDVMSIHVTTKKAVRKECKLNCKINLRKL